MIVVGAKGSRVGKGSVHIYKPNGDDNWDFNETLEPNVDATPGNGGNFGWEVDINIDNTVLCGAPFENGDGAMFIYKETEPNVWPLFDKVQSPNANALFGFSVSIGDGNDKNLAVVGARDSEIGGTINAGAVFVYQIPPGPEGTAIKEHTIIAENPSTDEQFGASVSLKGGNLVIGGPAPLSFGSAYLYYRVSDVWQVAERILAGSNGQSEYGAAVAVSQNAIMIGAPRDDSNTGSVTAFVVTGTGCGGPTEPVTQENPGQASTDDVSINPATSSVPGKRFVSFVVLFTVPNTDQTFYQCTYFFVLVPRQLPWESLSEREQQVAQVYLGYSQNVSRLNM